LPCQPKANLSFFMPIHQLQTSPLDIYNYSNFEYS